MSKRSFTHDRAMLVCADTREVEIPVADLLITDPPYGNGYQSNRRLDRFDGVQGDEDLQMVAQVLVQSWEAVRIHRHGYVFGPLHLGLVCPDITGASVELVWDKSAMSAGNMAAPWGNCHESIWFTSKIYESEKPTSGSTAARLRRGTVLRTNRSGETSRVHPTQKPVPLLAELVEMSSRLDELVLDPFMGVGSTCVAAVLEGRKAYGIEINSGYFDIAVERVKEAIRLRKQIEAMR